MGINEDAPCWTCKKYWFADRDTNCRSVCPELREFVRERN